MLKEEKKEKVGEEKRKQTKVEGRGERWKGSRKGRVHVEWKCVKGGEQGEESGGVEEKWLR